jgi:metal-responsive CopG/Arc/MetJ family transcriptional regulator
MATMNRNIPLSIDDELLAKIDRAAESTKESRSAVMRRAIREGLPVVMSGGGADVVCLDSELSKDVDQVSKDGQLNRAKVILESIRTGLQAFYNRLMREQVIHAQDRSPEEAERLLAVMEQTHSLDEPMAREFRTALRQRGAALIRLRDILEHVPEAWDRKRLIERLTEIRRSPGGLGVGVWGAGLSTEEIAWQIAMVEKYGGSTKIPVDEIKAREAAREIERETRRKAQADVAAMTAALIE